MHTWKTLVVYDYYAGVVGQGYRLFTLLISLAVLANVCRVDTVWAVFQNCRA